MEGIKYLTSVCLFIGFFVVKVREGDDTKSESKDATVEN
jgi:hypothetical protein